MTEPDRVPTPRTHEDVADENDMDMHALSSGYPVTRILVAALYWRERAEELEQSRDTYFAERNSARDVHREVCRILQHDHAVEGATKRMSELAATQEKLAAIERALFLDAKRIDWIKENMALVERAESAEEKLAAAERQRDNLLARIFRDGGQRQVAYATVEGACNAADSLCADYIYRAEFFESRADEADSRAAAAEEKLAAAENEKGALHAICTAWRNRLDAAESRAESLTEALRVAEEERDAWKDFAKHQEHCAVCAESVEHCLSGMAMRNAALQPEKEGK